MEGTRRIWTHNKTLAIMLFVMMMIVGMGVKAQDSEVFTAKKKTAASIENQANGIASRYDNLCNKYLADYIKANNISNDSINSQMQAVQADIEKLKEQLSKITPVIQVAENDSDIANIKIQFDEILTLAKKIKQELLDVCDDLQKISSANESKGGISGRQREFSYA